MGAAIINGVRVVQRPVTDDIPGVVPHAKDRIF